MTNDTARAYFVQNSIEFLRQHNFDGLDIWSISSPLKDEAIGYGKLMQELQQTYKALGLSLSISIRGNPTTYAKSFFDITLASNSSDWITFGLPSVRDEQATGNKLKNSISDQNISNPNSIASSDQDILLHSIDSMEV